MQPILVHPVEARVSPDVQGRRSGEPPVLVQLQPDVCLASSAASNQSPAYAEPRTVCTASAASRAGAEQAGLVSNRHPSGYPAVHRHCGTVWLPGLALSRTPGSSRAGTR